MRDLSNVTIFIKSFLRHGLLRDCVDGIEKNLPECSILIIDDSYPGRHSVTQTTKPNCTTVFMPFDSGFGAKSNEMLYNVRTKYVLIASDDFDFSPPSVREGIEKLHTVLENTSMSIASGRVNNNPYEFCFEFGMRDVGLGPEQFCKERPGYHGTWLADGLEYSPCDLTVNYSLIKTEILGFDEPDAEQPNLVHWDDDVKIGGGEHGAFFIDVFRAGHGVCYVPGVNINELPYDNAKVDPRYGGFRSRASEPGRICLKRRGIDAYCCGGTTWEQS